MISLQELNAAYRDGFAEISDEEYDAMAYGKCLPLGESGEVVLETPMLGLYATTDSDELGEWMLSMIESADHAAPVTASLKVDGVSMALRYHDGELTQALTRGDGHNGRDVTANVWRFLPMKVGRFSGEVRGEFFASSESLATNHDLRNAAAALARFGRKTKPFDFHWIAFHEPHLDLSSNGVVVVPRCRLDLTSTMAGIASVKAVGDRAGIPSDGVVVEFPTLKRMGYTATGPRWKLAYKGLHRNK